MGRKGQIGLRAQTLGRAFTSLRHAHPAVRATGLVYNSEHAAPTAFVEVDARPELGASGWVALSLRLESQTRNPHGTYPLVGGEYGNTGPWGARTGFAGPSHTPSGAVTALDAIEDHHADLLAGLRMRVGRD